MSSKAGVIGGAAVVVAASGGAVLLAANDGDGSVGTWWQEMSGLLGRSITVLGDVEDDDIDAYEVNGVAVRPLNSATPPWRDAEQVKAIALGQVPGIVTDARLELYRD